MHGLPFFKYSPSGNMTLLVVDPGLSARERAAIARRIMNDDHVGAEQVGYIDTRSSLPRLEMMGGELCVNACRSMAALLHAENRLTPKTGLLPTDPEYGWKYGLLQSSGVTVPLEVRARSLDSGDFPARHEAGVCLRLPAFPKIVELDKGIALLRLPGISHLVLDSRHHAFPADWRSETEALRHRFALEEDEAVGCLWLDITGLALTPVVWVNATEMAHLETACGSGTLACALYLSAIQKDIEHSAPIRIRQYGGEILEVRLNATEDTLEAWISGNVDCVARGELFIDMAEL